MAGGSDNRQVTAGVTRHKGKNGWVGALKNLL
jgi:hypothetical protein